MLYIYNSRKKTAGRGRCLPPTRPLLARPPPPPPAVLQLGRPPEAEADEAEAEAASPPPRRELAAQARPIAHTQPAERESRGPVRGRWEGAGAGSPRK